MFKHYVTFCHSLTQTAEVKTLLPPSPLQKNTLHFTQIVHYVRADVVRTLQILILQSQWFHMVKYSKSQNIFVVLFFL